MVVSPSDITLMSITFVQKCILVRIPLRKKCFWHNTKHVRTTLIMFNIFGTVSNSCGIEITVGKFFSKVVFITSKACTQQICTYCYDLMGSMRLPSRQEDKEPCPSSTWTDQRRTKGCSHRTLSTQRVLWNQVLCTRR